MAVQIQARPLLVLAFVYALSAANLDVRVLARGNLTEPVREALKVYSGCDS